jgi:hypothetical protein
VHVDAFLDLKTAKPLTLLEHYAYRDKLIYFLNKLEEELEILYSLPWMRNNR